MALPDHVQVIELQPFTSSAWGEWYCASCGDRHHVLDSRVARLRRVPDDAQFSVVLCGPCGDAIDPHGGPTATIAVPLGDGPVSEPTG